MFTGAELMFTAREHVFKRLELMFGILERKNSNARKSFPL